MINSESWVNASVLITNTAPNNATPYIFAQPFATDNIIRTNSSLNASSFVSDPDADSMTVTIVFWNGTKEHFRTNITSVANATNSSSTLTQNATNIFTKGENWTAAFRVNDGTTSSDWVNASITISNTQPENPNTTIRPLSPIRSNDLNCSWTYIDTNNDAGTATVIWYNNSLEHYRTNISVANNSNNTIVSYTLTRNNTNAFLSGQNWTCAAISNDGVINSDWYNSSVLIGTTVPNNATPYIFAQPFATDNIIRTNSSLNASSFVSDPDADSMTVTIVFWNGTKEHFRTNLTGVANATNSSSTLTQNATNIFTKGENWTAAFRVNDGTSSSDWVNASIIISNTQPENPNTTIRPLSPIRSNDLNCSWTYIDTNNDAGTGTIIWYNNSLEHFRTNISVENNSNNTIVSYTLTRNNTNIFNIGQNWTCAAISNDGVINSDWYNSSVVISNTVPNNATPYIFAQPFATDNIIRTNSSLNASSFIQDPDGDLMTVEIVFWNGSQLHFRTNLTNQANSSNASYTLTENQSNKFTKGEK